LVSDLYKFLLLLKYFVHMLK